MENNNYLLSEEDIKHQKNRERYQLYCSKVSNIRIKEILDKYGFFRDTIPMFRIKLLRTYKKILKKNNNKL